jgi:hypothetical protein
MNYLKLLLITAALSTTTAALAVDDQNTCDMNALPCNFIVHANMGRHMDLINIAQGAIYNCNIQGLAAIGNTAPAEGLTVNLSSHPSPNYGYDLKLDATQLKSNLGDLKFDAENYSDIPYNEVITCSKQ